MKSMAKARPNFISRLTLHPPPSLSPSHCTHFILFPHSIHILTHSPCSLYLSLSLSASGPDGSILARRIVNTNQHFLPPAIHITDIFLSISGLVFILFVFFITLSFIIEMGIDSKVALTAIIETLVLRYLYEF